MFLLPAINIYWTVFTDGLVMDVHLLLLRLRGILYRRFYSPLPCTDVWIWKLFRKMGSILLWSAKTALALYYYRLTFCVRGSEFFLQGISPNAYSSPDRSINPLKEALDFNLGDLSL